jgi:hypothetical protein
MAPVSASAEATRPSPGAPRQTARMFTARLPRMRCPLPRLHAGRPVGPKCLQRRALADAEAVDILAGTAIELLLNQKRGQVLPVDLAAEPEIRALLSGMDTTEPATDD